MVENDLVYRSSTQLIREALSDTPVVVLNGPRQSGKSTLVSNLGLESCEYRTLDDQPQLRVAKDDPVAFIDSSARVLVIDEVQRVPDLLLSIKASVDRDRRAGRFLLTGSTRLLSTPTISESLAGRVEILELWPLSRSELVGRTSGFVDLLFSSEVPRHHSDWTRQQYFEAMVAGGFPEATSRTARRREAWFRNYATTVVQRMVSDIVNAEDLPALTALLRLIAARTGSELSVASIANDLGLNANTASSYISYLETVFLLHRIPAWSRNLSKKIVRKPKMMISDVGLAAFLTHCDVDNLMQPTSSGVGGLVENFVAMEIQKESSWSQTLPSIAHFRDRDGAEVDLLLEARSGDVVGVEVKAASSIVAKDFRGLRLLQAKLGKAFKVGIVLYTGRDTVQVGQGLFAVPISAIWEL